MKVIRRTIGAQTVAAGIDRVVGSAFLPKGGKLLSVHGELHVVGEESRPVDNFTAYGFSGSMVPIVDPETAIGAGNVWDNAIVKALDPILAAAGVGLDLDWINADTSPEIEPGEIDVDALLGMTQGQKEFMSPRLEWMSWAKSRQGGWAAGTPDTYLPSDFKRFSSKIKLTADEPSLCMVGFSSPSLDDVRLQAADLTPGSAAEWYMLQNMKETLRDMGKMQAGISATGDLVEGVSATNLIMDLVAPSMLDESTTLYETATYDVLCVMTWFLELPDEDLPKMLDGR